MTQPVQVGVLARDLDCVDDLTPSLGEVTGRTCLIQCLARCTITPKGRLLSDPLWGFGVQLYLNDATTPAGIAFIQRGLREAYLRDERVIDAQVVVTFSLDVLTIAATITDSAGPFRLTLAVTDVSIAILQAG